MINLITYRKSVFLAFFILGSFFGFSQNCEFNFIPIENTGVNMIILIHDEALVTDFLTVGDSLGAFITINDEMVCVGSVVWDTEQQSLVVWGDDPFTPHQEAMLALQEITLFAKSNDVIYEVLYNPILEYSTNDIRTIDSSLLFTEYCHSIIEISGCTDSNFIEYNPLAILDDGSCLYSSDYFSDLGVPGLTDNNMSIVFTSGVFIGYEDMLLQAFVGDIQVSAATTIDSLGQAGLSVFGSDIFCNCDLATLGDQIEFAIYDSHNFVVVPFEPQIPILYQANDMIMVDSIVFNIYDPIIVDLIEGWNMVGYTGANITPIVQAMPSNFEEDFLLIKDVNGVFWNELVDILNVFEPGKGYLMYAKPNTDPPPLQFSQVYNSNISFQPTTGWNMIGFTGVDITPIEQAMPPNFEEDFLLIKDVNGVFWNELVDILNVFEPGKGYMMYVYPDVSPLPILDFTD